MPDRADDDDGDVLRARLVRLYGELEEAHERASKPVWKPGRSIEEVRQELADTKAALEARRQGGPG